jgi:hypothetical protein
MRLADGITSAQEAQEHQEPTAGAMKWMALLARIRAKEAHLRGE